MKHNGRPLFRVAVDKQPLSRAVNARLKTADEPLGVVMADLPFATDAAIGRLFELSADIVVAQGLGGGTNALIVRHPEFAVDYHDGTYLDHRKTASDIGASLETIDSFRLGVDIGVPADLAEVLLHGMGRDVGSSVQPF